MTAQQPTTDGLGDIVDLFMDMARAIAAEAPEQARAAQTTAAHIGRLPEDGQLVTPLQLGALIRRALPERALPERASEVEAAPHAAPAF